MLQIIKEQLLRVVDDIDAGNTNMTEEEEIKIAKFLNRTLRKDRPINKYQAYTYLGISRAKFDNMVREGIIPRGKKVAGSKELRWCKKDLPVPKNK
jgi:predicted DNA-binding transcriptional regulator AlpA